MKKSKNLFEDLYADIDSFINSSRFKKELNNQFKKFEEMFYDLNVTSLFSLDERELDILRNRYGVYTNGSLVIYKEVGKKYGLSKGRVEQIIAKAIKKGKKYLELFFREYEKEFYYKINILDFLDYTELPKELGEYKSITLEQLFSIDNTYKKNLIRNVIVMKIYKVTLKKENDGKDRLNILSLLLDFLSSINISDLFLSSALFNCLYVNDIYNLGLLVSKDDLYDIKDITKEMIEELDNYLNIDKVIVVTDIDFPSLSEEEFRENEYLINSTLEDLEFSSRLYNALKRAGVNYGEDLIGVTLEELVKKYNLGKKTAEDILKVKENIAEKVKKKKQEN